jgi:glycosyltransferase involved in cell wall biosynthesis
VEIFVNSRFMTQVVTGVQRYAIEICKQIKRQNPSTVLLAPNNILDKALAGVLGVRTVGKLTGHLWEQFDLPWFLKKHGQPVLVNLCNMAPLYYPRNVVTIHDLAVLHNPEWFSLKFRSYYRWALSQIARKSLKVLTVSSFSKQKITELLGVPEERVAVIPAAVAENFSRLADESFPNKYGRYVLAVSSLEPRKNFARLIEAFLRAKLQDVKLIVAGGQSRVFSDPGLQGILNNADNIILAGYLQDAELAGLYQHALCLVYPSLYEGFGLPALEAMACGCPVVVSRIASLSEVCGDAAYYVEPHDIDSIADGICKVATDEQLRKTLMKKGSERVAMFSWKASAKQLLEVIEEVAER